MYHSRILDIFYNPSPCIPTLSEATLGLPHLLNDHSSPFEVFNTFTDIAHFERTPFSSCYRKIRLTPGLDTWIRILCDGFSSLELELHRVTGITKLIGADRKYTWNAEIKCPKKKGFDLKHDWKAEVKHGVDRKYCWTAEIKGGNEGERALKKRDKCTSEIRWKHHRIKESKSHVGVCILGANEVDKKKGASYVRVVEIEEPVDQRTIFRRQAFDKRLGILPKARGKKNELSPQVAALMIQRSFREHLIRRSQALRSFRVLAVAKARLREIRALFNNFSYRQQLTRDAEERQRFSEKIIDLILTVNAIEGADFMVRGAKKSMLNELEAILDVVDPQRPGKLDLFKRRKFDLPAGCSQNEIAAGVAEVIQMLDQAEKYDNATFEVCL